MNTHKIFAIALTAVFGLLTFSVMAQGGPGGPPPPPGGTSGPIDGGAVALLIGAAAYGYNRLKQQDEEPK